MGENKAKSCQFTRQQPKGKTSVKPKENTLHWLKNCKRMWKVFRIFLAHFPRQSLSHTCALLPSPTI